MFKRGMDSKGQLSVEYLLLLVVIFVVFGAMITYLIGPSIDSANDISDVSAASNAINDIANAGNLVYSNGPGSKRTVQVYIPNNVAIGLNEKGVSANITLSNGTIKTINAPTYGKMQNNVYNVTGYHRVTILWPQSDWRILNYII